MQHLGLSAEGFDSQDYFTFAPSTFAGSERTLIEEKYYRGW